MTIKGFIVLGLLVAAVLLWFLVGFNIVSSTKYDLVVLGLFAQGAAFLVHLFMPGPELT